MTRRILLVIGGGIAAYKSLELIRLLRADGMAVSAVMTEAAEQFVTPLSVQALTGEHVHRALFSLTEESEMGHIALSRSADLIVICPASANLLARMRAGLADDLATTLLLATDTPVLVAPAMNVRMWEHPATADNVAALKARGIGFVGPNDGDMACGEFGPGRLSEPHEIVAAIRGRLSEGPLAGRHALVTAGPTIEAIDPVRYIGNHSSGRQGYAIAAELADLGARVTLVSGPTALVAPKGVMRVDVRSAREMLAACEAALPADIAVCVAAVADWRVADQAAGKIKKTAGGQPPALALVENPDILSILAHHASRPELVVGFAAETETVLEHGRAKRVRKRCDWLLANDVSGNVFGSSRNAVVFLNGHEETVWPETSKVEVARRLARKIADRFQGKPSLHPEPFSGVAEV